MQPELVGDLLHGHRLEVFNALRKKIVLSCNEDIRNALDRLLPLFKRLHQPVSVREFVPDIGTDVIGRVRVFKHLQVELRNAQMRNVRIVVNDFETVAVSLHGHLGNDIDGLGVGNDIPGTRIELFDFSDLSVELLQGDVPRFRKLGKFVARNILQMVFDKVSQFRRILPETAELENETFLEVARADSRRIKALHQPDRLLRLLKRTAAAGGNIGGMSLEVTGFVYSADNGFSDAGGLRIGVGNAELVKKLFLHGNIARDGIEKIRLPFIFILRVVTGGKRRLFGRESAGGEFDDAGKFIFHVVALGAEFGLLLIGRRFGELLRGGFLHLENGIHRKLLIDLLLKFKNRCAENVKRLKLLRRERLFLSHHRSLRHSLN